MYDLYPDWGPARHRDRHDAWDTSDTSDTWDPWNPAGPRPAALASVQAGLDLRDHGGERPDDN